MNQASGSGCPDHDPMTIKDVSDRYDFLSQTLTLR
ncbi:hypothetical protein AESSP_02032 [Aestuariimicrobium sp. T2.26MG-19.2B]|nr:hypothetical protein AESSP_02032 [Aestuariimicrobium sp. T2.26MG-19.2B]